MNSKVICENKMKAVNHCLNPKLRVIKGYSTSFRKEQFPLNQGFILVTLNEIRKTWMRCKFKKII
jgi:hypothetical protein